MDTCTENSARYRDRISHLYIRCRCGCPEAYSELKQLAACDEFPTFEDSLIAKGYLGYLLVRCNSQLIPFDKKQGAELLSHLSHLDKDSFSCHHMKHLLGVYYRECCSFKHLEAVELFQQAADEGNAFSHAALAYFYSTGDGVKQSHTKVFDLLSLAASKDYPVAQCNLGKCYMKRIDGFVYDSSMAAHWFQKSANQGYAEGLYRIGVCYRKGHGVEKSHLEAARYWEMATKQGHTDSQYRLARLYHSGKGVDKDDYKAFELFRQSAKQGNYAAAQYVGKAYDEGWGVESNIVEAMRYYRQTLQETKPSIYSRYASTRISSLSYKYKEAMWNNRKSFLLFLWGCNFIYRPGVAVTVSPQEQEQEQDQKQQQERGKEQQTSAGPEAGSVAGAGVVTGSIANNIVHETFYIHDIRYTIMGFL